MQEVSREARDQASLKTLELGIKDLDTGRVISFEHADLLWQPMLVRDLDSNVLLPFSPEVSASNHSEQLLNAPEELSFHSCVLQQTMAPPPLSLPSYTLYRLKKKAQIETFNACRRSDESGRVHFDVRWFDGPLRFTGKLETMPRSSPHVQELAMYDDYINYYGFPRELGFIRIKRLMQQELSCDRLLEVIIPRVSADGTAAQFRVNAVPGQSMLSMYKAKRAVEHMLILRGRLSFFDKREMVELRYKDELGEFQVVFRARRVKAKGQLSWRIGFKRPLSAFQTFCILLALESDPTLAGDLVAEMMRV